MYVGCCRHRFCRRLCAHESGLRFLQKLLLSFSYLQNMRRVLGAHAASELDTEECAVLRSCRFSRYRADLAIGLFADARFGRLDA
jgi:hypothetical protein